MAAAKKAKLVVQLKSGHALEWEVPADYELPKPDENGWVEYGHGDDLVGVHHSNVVLSRLSKQ